MAVCSSVSLKAFARFEVNVQFVLTDKFSYTVAVR